MSCSSFREGWQIGAAEGHAASCASCADWVADQRRAAAALARLAAGLDGAVVPDEREAALRAAFRQALRPDSRSQHGRWLWGWAAVAACLLVAVGFVLRDRPGAPSPVQVAAVPGATPAPVPVRAPHAASGTSPSARPTSPRTPRAATVPEAPPRLAASNSSRSDFTDAGRMSAPCV